MVFPTLTSPTSAASATQPGWLGATALALAEAITHTARVVWLLLIFAPVLLSSPLALQLNLYRAEWMELLRRTLEAGGERGVRGCEV